MSEPMGGSELDPGRVSGAGAEPGTGESQDGSDEAPSRSAWQRFSDEDHPLRRFLGSNDLLAKLVRLVCMILAAIVVSYYITLRVPLGWQLLSSLSLLVFSIWISRYRPDMRLFLMLLSTSISLRYLYWRATNTLEFDSAVNAGLGYMLFFAELYGIMILLLGYFQTVEELHRRPVPLPSDVNQLPWVDIFIPTYNEDESIVGRTATGALMIDYPRKRVYILDDGRRPTMEALARRLGCGYLIRSDNKHAKAGNINAALKRTNGDLVAIFDADHVPVRSFLQMTVGFFLEDPKLALVQTPHHFFNPDPFQRNLLVEGRVPAEQELFYHVILVGDDFWNSTFFCGSCAVLRRTALLEVGGIAQETVTEDAHTSLKMHARGWKSAYLAIPQAAGLATERFAYHVKQRMRWAQGMTQIFRLDNPLLKKGLTFAQRLNYFNAMMHFMFGIPRLVYVIAPLTYLLFGAKPVHADPWEIFAYAIPHIVMSGVSNSLLFRGFRHSFWAEVYEMAIAWPSAVITVLTMISPKNAKFNVTAKGGGQLDSAEFDWRNARPNLVLAALSFMGILAAPLRYQLDSSGRDANTILLNTAWTIFNLIMLSSAILAALEQRQLRQSYRLHRVLNGMVQLEDGRWLPIETADLSETGVRFRVLSSHLETEVLGMQRVRLVSNSGLQVELDIKSVYERRLNGELVVGACFLALDPVRQRQLVQLLFSAADSWIDFEAPLDHYVRGFVEVLRTPLRVLYHLYRQALQDGRELPMAASIEAERGAALESIRTGLPSQSKVNAASIGMRE